MLSQEEILRYNRQINLPEIGLAGQKKLKKASVLVVGAGGLGSPVLMYLTAAGIGRIGIIDSDAVSLSNLQRQILYNSDELGQSKIKTANNKLSKLNPNTVFDLHDFDLNCQNAAGIISKYDIVVDCTDNFMARYIINDTCVMLGKPFVFASVQNYEGQVSVFNYRNGPTYRCLYPEPPPESDTPTVEKSGLPAVLPGITGSLQANEVMKIITETGEVLSGKLLIFNILKNSFVTLKISLVNENRNITELNHPILFPPNDHY